MCCQPILKSATPNISLAPVVSAVKDFLSAIGAFTPLQSKDDCKLVVVQDGLRPMPIATPKSRGDSVPMPDPTTIPAVERPMVVFKPGDVVNVLPRLWPGN